MNYLLVFLLCIGSALVSCSGKEKKQYKLDHLKNGNSMLTEVKSGIANGRATIYSPSGKILSILHLKDGAFEGYVYGFDEEGRVRKIDFYRGGWQNGYAYEFYENHLLASITSYVNDKKTGVACTFYPTGGLKTKVNLINDLANGDFLVFHKIPSNCTHRRIQYCIVRGKQFINGETTYNSSGQVVNQKDVLEIKFDKPIYRLNEKINLIIKILGPRMSKMVVFLAPFDSLFYKHGSESERRVYGKNHVATIKIEPGHIGVNYVRGYVTDYDSIPPHKKGALYETMEKDIYFQRKYLVK